MVALERLWGGGCIASEAECLLRGCGREAADSCDEKDIFKMADITQRHRRTGSSTASNPVAGERPPVLTAAANQHESKAPQPYQTQHAPPLSLQANLAL